MSEEINSDDLPIAHVSNDPNLVAPPHPEKGHIDNTALFLTYISFLGDTEKTAAACNISPLYVDEIARSERWGAKVAALTTLRREKGADALAKEINRTNCFVQAIRLRNLIDRVLTDIFNDKVKYEDLVTIRGKNADNFSAKGLVELCKAAETAHRMAYNALGDSLVERASKDDDSEANQVSLSVLRALAAATPVQKIVDPEAPVRKIILEGAQPDAA